MLIAKNGRELNSMADDLREANGEFGLGINFSKTKVLSSISNLEEIKLLGDMVINKVQDYRCKFLNSNCKFK